MADRNTSQKHMWRARIVLLAAEGLGTAAIMRRSGKSKNAVNCWHQRFCAEGVDGLLRDKTWPPRIPPPPAVVRERTVALRLADPPGEATHWTAAMMAKAAAISVSSVQRIWRAYGLQPHGVRQFKLARDPQFAAKLNAIVGLYLDPPAHAVGLSVDAKSQIQSLPLARTGALDRTQAGPPLKPGRSDTMTHDYKRHGTTTLFAALNVLEGKIIGAACSATVTRRSFASSMLLRPTSRRPKRPCHPQRLCHPQAPQGPHLARPASALRLPLPRARPPGSMPSRALGQADPPSA